MHPKPDQTITSYFINIIFQNAHEESISVGKENRESFIEAGKDFLLESRKEIERRTTNMIQGQCSAEKYARLIRDKRDTIQMAALEQRGVSELKLRMLRQNVIETIISSAYKLTQGRLIRNPDNPNNSNMGA